jgi:hypothetical protein
VCFQVAQQESERKIADLVRQIEEFKIREKIMELEHEKMASELDLSRKVKSLLSIFILRFRKL